MLPRFSSFLLPLCLLISPGVLSTIPAPTNFSVTCRNFKNVLYWNYSEPDLQPEFNITIRGYDSYSEPLNLLTSQTYLDISEYTQKIEDSYYVTLEAQANGSELSSSSQDVSFTYNENLPSEQTCMMDFPVIKFSVLQRGVDFSFSHPFNVHNVPYLENTFIYIVRFNETKSKFNCNEDEDCTGVLPLTEGLYGKCMSVYVQGDVEGISAKTTEEVCGKVRPNDTDWPVLVTILLCSGGALLFLIILAVVVYIKLTRPDSQSTIISKLLGMVNSDHVVHVPEHADVTEVTSIGQTPLLETCDPDFSNPSSPVFDSVPTHIPDQFDPDIKQSEDDEEGADSGGFNSGNSFSGYDSQKFPIDMGQGDIVEAYGPR